jgi:hypothetical protein
MVLISSSDREKIRLMSTDVVVGGQMSLESTMQADKHNKLSVRF